MRRFQISLRKLMLTVTLISLACGWGGWQVSRARAQREGVAALRANGVGIAYDFQTRPQDESRVRAWLRLQIGDDYFARPVAFYFVARSPTKDELELIRRLGGGMILQD